jgi:hypothetical protein
MPLTPEQEWNYWDGQVTELRHHQLATVQSAATGWKTLFAALLGIFTTVAFAGGLTTVDKLASPWDTLVKGATLVAVVCAAAATYWANKASQGLSPGAAAELDADSIRDRSDQAANASLVDLNKAKVAGVLAVVIVLAGSAAVLLLGPAPTPSVAPTAVVIVNGRAVCGKLTRAADRSLMIDGTGLGTGVSGFTVVSKCP